MRNYDDRLFGAAVQRRRHASNELKQKGDLGRERGHFKRVTVQTFFEFQQN